jgi:hypothetical protein
MRGVANDDMGIDWEGIEEQQARSKWNDRVPSWEGFILWIA